MNLYELYQLTEEKYKGEHLAPDKNDTPLWNMTKDFPDDIYSSHAYKHYGYISNHHMQAISIIQEYQNKPHKKIRIYRAVPDNAGDLKKQLTIIKKLRSYVYKHKFLPLKYEEQYSQYIDIPKDLEYEPVPLLNFLDDEIDKLKSNIKKNRGKQNYGINEGDWVALTKGYAEFHGQSNLNNNYLIKSMVVHAKDLFTAGDVTEWGYDPN